MCVYVCVCVGHLYSFYVCFSHSLLLTNILTCSSPGPKRLNNLIVKLKRWIKILEMKTKSLHRSFLLEDRCRFLSNFSLSTADVEMPGEYLEPQVCKWERQREREERGRGREGGREG